MIDKILILCWVSSLLFIFACTAYYIKRGKRAKSGSNYTFDKLYSLPQKDILIKISNIERNSLSILCKQYLHNFEGYKYNGHLGTGYYKRMIMQNKQDLYALLLEIQVLYAILDW